MLVTNITVIERSIGLRSIAVKLFLHWPMETTDYGFVGDKQVYHELMLNVYYADGLAKRAVIHSQRLIINQRVDIWHYAFAVILFDLKLTSRCCQLCRDTQI